MKYVICFLIINLNFYALIFAQGGDEFQATPGGIYAWGPRMCSLANGKFVVCWQEPFGVHEEIYGQLFDSSGSKIGDAFLVNSEPQVHISRSYIRYPMADSLYAGIAGKKGLSLQFPLEYSASCLIILARR